MQFYAFCQLFEIEIRRQIMLELFLLYAATPDVAVVKETAIVSKARGSGRNCGELCKFVPPSDGAGSGAPQSTHGSGTRSMTPTYFVRWGSDRR
jgi:hypothetical protein